MKAYRAQLRQCRQELAKSPLIPIIGGGYLDTRYFAFNVPSVRYTNGECGTDLFTAEFRWTGEKIVANSMEMMGIDVPKPIPRGWNPIPKEWLFFQVGVRFGNLKKTKHCKGNYGLIPECPHPDITYPAMDIPSELKVIPKNYPDLEIWLSERSFKSMGSVNFTIPSWRRPDGYPRFISCSPRGGEYEKTTFTREDYEKIDFKQHRFPCKLEYRSFPVKGGGARIYTGTEALRDIVPALQALETYINQSIIWE